ncbi:MAG: hypothetical protein NW205_04515 [Hyphomicrobiaceae bacterium]|nr:hypothetical protein [Hyphomicrobiaceae bacterium]
MAEDSDKKSARGATARTSDANRAASLEARLASLLANNAAPAGNGPTPPPLPAAGPPPVASPSSGGTAQASSSAAPPPSLPAGPRLASIDGALALDQAAATLAGLPPLPSRSSAATAAAPAVPPPMPSAGSAAQPILLDTAPPAAPRAAEPRVIEPARIEPTVIEPTVIEHERGLEADDPFDADGDAAAPLNAGQHRYGAPPPPARPSEAGQPRPFEPSHPADETAREPGDGSAAQRRSARRRPAGPVRERIAANDDAPSIGGLIYSLQQKPSTKPFKYAAIASVVWTLVGAAFLWLTLTADMETGLTTREIVAKPTTFLMFTAVAVPIAVIWFLALLAWRSEELRLRSSTMAEVAVRLAEPDRMAEQSVASLGQAVRRQVSFMNDAVSRALGRAGELEALVHNEVAALERSYEENEQKIRGLIKELSGERSELLRTGGDVTETLRQLGSEVPALIEKLSSQQAKLAHIIQGAGDNLTLLESSLEHSAGKLEASVGARTNELREVLEGYTEALDTALGNRTEEMGGVLAEHTGRLGGVLENYTGALADVLGNRTEQMQEAFAEYMTTLDTSLANRTDNLQTVFEEYARALDTTIAGRAELLDQQLVERTRALDDAFNQRLLRFDETIMRTTSAIDGAVSQRAVALTEALESHARTFQDTIARQSAHLDESLAHGINAVRRSSENITRQSLKAIEGLANQSELLKNVSENLLSQINAVTNRFENQGQTIMRAANALESANVKIDSALQSRHAELSHTLDRMTGKADEFSRFIEGYSSSIEGKLGEAESRARAAAQQLLTTTESNTKAALADLSRFTQQADVESTKALRELRQRFNAVSREVTSQLGTLSSRFDETTDQVRTRAQKATQAIEEEQARLKAELASIPGNARESTEAMRRALQDQLRALDQLSQLTLREAQARDVTLPNPQAGPGGRAPLGGPGTPGPSPYAAGNGLPRSRAETDRQLSSLTSTLANELAQRTGVAPMGMPGAPGYGAPPAGPGAGPSHMGQQAALPSPSGYPASPAAMAGGAMAGGGAPAPGAGPAGGNAPPSAADLRWSVGDLLKRASTDDNDDEISPVQAATALLPDVGVMIRAIDPATAAAIWARLRAGQQGVMIRSMYAPEARAAFEDVAMRHRQDPQVQRAVGQVLAEFERTLREAEQADPSGRLLQSHLVSEMGRVYLFLSHASGRLG